MSENKNAPKRKISQMGMKIIFIAAGWLLIFAATALDTSIKIPVYEIYTDKVDKPVRIMLLTDFHGSGYGEGQQVLIDAVREQDPDVILMAGDMFEDFRPPENSLELMKRLGGEYPCYYSSGNHEKWYQDLSEIKETVRSCGIKVLEGSGENVSFAGQEIRICGVDYGFENYEDPYENCKRGDETFTVLMSHRPDLVDMYSRRGFDLVVCGHAHGGQVIIPGVLNGLYAPDQGIFPKYAGGRYLLEDGVTEMIVSRGLCKNFLPRVFNRPEAVVIDIVENQ